MKFDFHTHSYYSDGRVSPTELVREVKRLDLEVIALTDHESVGGIPEAIEAGKNLGVKIVPGIEFAALDHEGVEQHLLGLLIDYQSKALKSFLETWETTRIHQIQKIMKNLQAKGFKVEFEEVAKQAKGSMHRAHVGHAIFENEKNSEILEKMGIKTPNEFFDRLLAEDSSGTSYAGRKKPMIGDVIGLIQEIGGTAVWAHPFWKKQDAPIIKQKCLVFQKLGLAGIEVCYSRVFSNREAARSLHEIAKDLGLYETAGSDFHAFGTSKFNKLANFETFDLDLEFPPGIFEIMQKKDPPTPS